MAERRGGGQMRADMMTGVDPRFRELIDYILKTIEEV